MATETLLAGPELDAEIARRVMGSKDVRPCDGGLHPISGRCRGWIHGSGHTAVPRWSTDIADAWHVIEKMRLTLTPAYPGWRAGQCNWGQSGETTAVGMTNYKRWIEADTAPLAICRAALAALEGD